MTDIVFGPCIFCGEQIAEKGVDPVALEAIPKTGQPIIWCSAMGNA